MQGFLHIIQFFASLLNIFNVQNIALLCLKGVTNVHHYAHITMLNIFL